MGWGGRAADSGWNEMLFMAHFKRGHTYVALCELQWRITNPQRLDRQQAAAFELWVRCRKVQVEIAPLGAHRYAERWVSPARLRTHLASAVRSASAARAVTPWLSGCGGQLWRERVQCSRAAARAHLNSRQDVRQQALVCSTPENFLRSGITVGGHVRCPNRRWFSQSRTSMCAH